MLILSFPQLYDSFLCVFTRLFCKKKKNMTDICTFFSIFAFDIIQSKLTMMKKTLSFSYAAFLLGGGNAMAQQAESTESFSLSIVVMLAVILALMIFTIARFWRATNDIKSLKAKICDKGLAERTIMRSEVMKLHLINKDEEAYEILNDALYNEARRLYRTTNDEKDYKEMVFMQGEGESRKVSCAEYFEKKWKQMQEKYQPLYDAISHDIPEGLKTVSYDYIRQFGKGENLKKE